MVTVLTETALIEQGVSRELLGEHKLNTDLMVLDSVNPPPRRERAKSSSTSHAGRARTPTRGEPGSKRQEDMTEVLNYTQKAFSSALR